MGYSRSSENATRRRPWLERLEDRTTPSVLAGGTKVNTTIAFDQHDSASASFNNGHVVVWASLNAAKTTADIFAQRFNASRTKLGSQIRVTSAPSFDFNPAVCIDNVGNFVITWTETLSSTKQNVKMSRYNAAGIRQGDIASVADSPVKEHSASIACSTGGEFVVSYTTQVSASNFDVRAKRYAANGTLLQEIPVATTTRKEQASQIARSKGTNAVFYIVYRTGNDVAINRYSKTGIQLGNIVAVTKTTATETSPAIAIDNTGRAVVAWSEGTSAKARRMSPSGTLSPVFVVTEFTDNDPVPQVAMHPVTGSFAITYQQQIHIPGGDEGFMPEDETNIHLREYLATGMFLRDTYIADYTVAGLFRVGPMYASISINARGYFVISYTRESNFADAEDIFVRWGKLA